MKLGGFQVNLEKTFAFGNKCLQGNINEVESFKDSFRLAGGSIMSSEISAWTDLEETRTQGRRKTMQHIGKAPLPWQEKQRVCSKL